MNDWRLFLIPLISALIGWLTNWIAVRMLFRPRKPVRIFGLTFHGLVPKRQSELADSIGHTVETHLISPKDIASILEQPQLLISFETIVKDRVHLFLNDRIMQINPMLGAFLSASIRQRIEDLLVDEIRQMMPTMIDSFTNQFDQSLDLKSIVADRIRAFDLEKLESIIYEIASRELKMIEWLGGVLGFLIGLIQVLIFTIGS